MKQAIRSRSRYCFNILFQDIWVIHLLCPQGSSPQCGKDTISPVIGRNVKPTKHLRRSDSLVKQNSETKLLLTITECH